MSGEWRMCERRNCVSAEWRGCGDGTNGGWRMCEGGECGRL